MCQYKMLCFCLDRSIIDNLDNMHAYELGLFYLPLNLGVNRYFERYLIHIFVAVVFVVPSLHLSPFFFLFFFFVFFFVFLFCV